MRVSLNVLKLPAYVCLHAEELKVIEAEAKKLTWKPPVTVASLPGLAAMAAHLPIGTSQARGGATSNLMLKGYGIQYRVL